MTPEERAEAFIGQRFGYLVVTGVVGLRAPRGGKKKMMYVTCDCDCGRKDHIIMLDSIRYGKSYSCGCARSLHDRPTIFGGHLAVRALVEYAWDNNPQELREIKIKTTRTYIELHPEETEGRERLLLGDRWEQIKDWNLNEMAWRKYERMQKS